MPQSMPSREFFLTFVNILGISLCILGSSGYHNSEVPDIHREHTTYSYHPLSLVILPESIML
jgi:hypothetical protein